MRQHVVSPYASILFYYDLYPDHIEDLGKVKKVTTSRGIFALKETTMNRMEADEFIHAMRKLSKLNYKQAIPIMPTKYGEYTVATNTHTYYVMPWYEGVEYMGRESQEEKLATQMAVIHRLTVKTQTFVKEQVDQSFNELQKRWEMKRLELNRFADFVERKNYMSPFELTFITHAHMLDQMAVKASEHLQNWYEACLEKEKYRTVLCHGRISRAHAIFNMENEPTLINFEKASVDTPARDLASFCRQNFRYTMWNEDEVLRWFMRYERHLPLLDEEKELLCGYLMFPEPVVFAVESYINKRSELSELQHVQRLEKRLISLRKVQRLSQKLIIPPEGS
ncbi:spore coat protein YsxE [Alkalihalophilus marmarensis]|uniref:spore coat protein YsxE n=1 Tax=Alkalihalophilus marmarensis TaxID=521377 RepID=UPI002DBC8A53|nr:spore coat protein YsxE [Alkalihalophilus marmarensis]MEC2071630.1 spore coat protein YsxE [Alkalihalophilus marmarensis]